MQINCTVTRHNVSQIDRLYAMALELGADALHLFMLVPVGCGVQIAGSNMLPSDEYERVLHWIYDRSLERKIHMKATCAPHYFRVMKQRQAQVRRTAENREPRVESGEVSRRETRSETNVPRTEDGNGTNGRLPIQPSSVHGLRAAEHPRSGQPGMFTLTKGCLAGSEICFVSHTGEVFPCGYLPVSAGNVLRESFRDIWENSDLFGRLRDDGQLEGKCGVCEFKRVCLGCRARAYYDSGNYMAEEPYCIHQPRRLSDAPAGNGIGRGIHEAHPDSERIPHETKK
jgi:radical SAM protein with 4Fe4S-binding SPASM domain